MALLALATDQEDVGVRLLCSLYRFQLRHHRAVQITEIRLRFLGRDDQGIQRPCVPFSNRFARLDETWFIQIKDQAFIAARDGHVTPVARSGFLPDTAAKFHQGIAPPAIARGHFERGIATRK